MKNSTLNIILWVFQILLGGMFLLAGIMKTFTPIVELGESLNWVLEYPNLVRFIGVSELLGGIGLILPAALKIMPRLTAYAGFGLGIIMILAIGFHVMRSEFEPVALNVIMGGIAFFIFWGRSKRLPITKKTA